MADDEAFRRGLDRRRELATVEAGFEQRQSGPPVYCLQAERPALSREVEHQSGAVVGKGDVATLLAHHHDPVASNQRRGQAVADPARARRQGAVRPGRHRGDQVELLGRRRYAMESLGKLVGDIVGRYLAGLEPFLVHDRRQEGDVVAKALDVEVLQRPPHALDRIGPLRRPGAQLGDHRVVEHRNFVAFPHAGVVAHGEGQSRPFRRWLVADKPSDRRQELAVGILGVDPALHRPAVDLQVGLGERQRFAGSHADHLLDQVDPGDQFRNRVLDLKTRVHLQEIEGLILTGYELDRARRVVVHGLRQGDGLGAHGHAGLLVQQR